MPETNNPANRLYSQLEVIRSKSKPVNSKIKLRAVLAELSGHNATETAKLFLFLVELAALAKQTAEAVQTIQNINHKTYLVPLEKIEKGLLSTNVEVLAKTFSNRILTDMDMFSLRACADMLSTVYIDTTIPANDINGLQKDVDSLLAEVLKINFPPDLRDFLIDNLEKIRQALLGYKVRGNQGIKEVLESILGATFLRRDQIVEEAKDETKKKALEKFFALIEKTSKIVALAEKVKSLAGPIVTMLLPKN